jgi:hypothetical protein
MPQGAVLEANESQINRLNEGQPLSEFSHEGELGYLSNVSKPEVLVLKKYETKMISKTYRLRLTSLKARGNAEYSAKILV